MAEEIKEEGQSFEQILKEALVGQKNYPAEQDKEDEETAKLIPQEAEEKIITDQQKPKNLVQQVVEKEQQVIDPIAELVKNKNVLPVLAVLEHLELNMDVDRKPLLSRLCTMNIPLGYHLRNREIIFENDQDNRTALHDAIAADDILSANWCIENKITNTKDNFGNTPIIQAIKLGRKNAFLLLLHYEYYDSEAPHVCATFNRLWQLKVLQRLGYDIVSVRDSEHFSPLERAVANYSYDVAQYLAYKSDNVSPGYLANKTESKAIIRTITRVKDSKSLFNNILPFLQLFFHLAIIYMGLGTFQLYNLYIQPFYQGLIALAVSYGLLFFFGQQRVEKQDERVNIMRLLKAPEFPVLQDICPETLQFYDASKEYCSKCKVSKQRFHFHGITCVSKNNQIFWLIIQVLWFVIAYNLHQIVVHRFTFENLIVLNFSDSFLFRNSILIEILYNKCVTMLLWFLYVKILMIYQAFCLFQWFSMLVLDRTYQEINNTQNYKRLYRIVQTSQGGFKNQEIKLLQSGFWLGMIKGGRNVVEYFFK